MTSRARFQYSKFSLGGTLLAATLFSTMPLHAQKLKDGTMVVNLQSPIGTESSKEGDTFTASVIEPAKYAGAIVEGKIQKVNPAVAGSNDKAKFVFAFTSITMPDNDTYKMSAELKEVTNAKGVAKVDDEGQVIGRGNGAKRALMAGGGAGAGALVGGMFGGSLGALAGGAIGGAAGYLVSLEVTAGGQNVNFSPGTHFSLEVKSHGKLKDADAAAIRTEANTNVTRYATPAPDATTVPASAKEVKSIALVPEDGKPVPAPDAVPAPTPKQ
jgi:hypothetical protein